MKIRVLGGGWYGCHMTAALAKRGHETALHEISDDLFAGASGANPARLHLGFHYPRSKLTRAMSQEHYSEFMKRYSHLTRNVRTNVYAVASGESLVDFANYVQVLRGEVEFVTVQPHEYGLQNVEGAVLTGERHINIRAAREFFKGVLAERIQFRTPRGTVDSGDWDYTIDCTFCAMDAANIDRYEPCMTVLMLGPTHTAVTIMDGPFPSVYPWNEEASLSSLTSAKYTPLARCKTREESDDVLQNVKSRPHEIEARIWAMAEQMAYYYPEFCDRYKPVDVLFSTRAMPASGSDARLVDVVRVGKRALRVRAGKIDAVEHAVRVVSAMLEEA